MVKWLTIVEQGNIPGGFDTLFIGTEYGKEKNFDNFWKLFDNFVFKNFYFTPTEEEKVGRYIPLLLRYNKNRFKHNWNLDWRE